MGNFVVYGSGEVVFDRVHTESQGLVTLVLYEHQYQIEIYKRNFLNTITIKKGNQVVYICKDINTSITLKLELHFCINRIEYWIRLLNVGPNPGLQNITS